MKSQKTYCAYCDKETQDEMFCDDICRRRYRLVHDAFEMFRR